VFGQLLERPSADCGLGGNRIGHGPFELLVRDLPAHDPLEEVLLDQDVPTEQARQQVGGELDAAGVSFAHGSAQLVHESPGLDVLGPQRAHGLRRDVERRKEVEDRFLTRVVPMLGVAGQETQSVRPEVCIDPAVGNRALCLGLHRAQHAEDPVVFVAQCVQRVRGSDHDPVLGLPHGGGSSSPPS
jgi:hypothetical protein